MNYINVGRFRESSKLHWQELWNSDQAYGMNIKALIDRFIYYPNHELQSLIVASYCCQHLQLLDRAFLLYFYGQSRTQKSQSGTLCANLHGYESIVASVAGVRNFVKDRLYLKDDENGTVFEDGLPIEQNIFIHFEDTSESELREPNFFRLLKISRDRNNKMIISGETTGSTATFLPFCLGAISSVFAPFTNDRFDELTNRCLFIECKRHEEDIDDISQYSLDGIAAKHLEAWSSEKCNEYLKLNRKIRRRKNFTPSQWELSKSCIISGFVQGLFDSIDSGVDVFSSYWKIRNEIHNKFENPLKKQIRFAIEEWSELKGGPFQGLLLIPKEWLVKFLQQRKQMGELTLNTIPLDSIPKFMFEFGFFESTGQQLSDQFGIPISQKQSNLSIFWRKEEE